MYFLIHRSLSTNKYALLSISITITVHFRICSLFHHRALLGSGICSHTNFASHQRESLRRKHISLHPKHHKLHSPLPFSVSWTQRILYRRVRLCSLLPSTVCFWLVTFIAAMQCRSNVFYTIQKRAPRFLSSPSPNSFPPLHYQRIPPKCSCSSLDSPYWSSF